MADSSEIPLLLLAEVFPIRIHPCLVAMNSKLDIFLINMAPLIYKFILFNTLIIIFIFIKSMSLLRLLILSSQHRSNSAAICGKGMFHLV
jgi:hypothetical protein